MGDGESNWLAVAGNFGKEIAQLPPALFNRLSWMFCPEKLTTSYQNEAISKATRQYLEDAFPKYIQHIASLSPDQNPALVVRAVSMETEQIVSKQKNREHIAKNAIIELEDIIETGLPEKEPSKEFKDTFFRYAENISTEEAQKLWGKLLAGEIRNPGSFCPMTMSILSKMSIEHAEIFRTLCHCTPDDDPFTYVYFNSENKLIPNGYAASILESYGLIKMDGYIYRDEDMTLSYGKYKIIIKSIKNKKIVTDVCTPFAYELRQLVTIDSNLIDKIFPEIVKNLRTQRHLDIEIINGPEGVS